MFSGRVGAWYVYFVDFENASLVNYLFGLGSVDLIFLYRGKVLGHRITFGLPNSTRLVLYRINTYWFYIFNCHLLC